MRATKPPTKTASAPTNSSSAEACRVIPLRRGTTRHGRSDDELAVLLHDDAVDFELAAEAEVADEVGMDGRLVGAPGLGVGRADGHVDGAADLLVEQDLAGATVDRVV